MDDHRNILVLLLQLFTVYLMLLMLLSDREIIWKHRRNHKVEWQSWGKWKWAQTWTILYFKKRRKRSRIRERCNKSFKMERKCRWLSQFHTTTVIRVLVEEPQHSFCMLLGFNRLVSLPPSLTYSMQKNLVILCCFCLLPLLMVTYFILCCSRKRPIYMCTHDIIWRCNMNRCLNLITEKKKNWNILFII